MPIQLNAAMKLRAWLNQQRLTTAEFAKRIDVGQAAVSRYCLDQRMPRRAVMQRIVAATGGAVTPNDFLPCAAATAPAQADQVAA